MRNTHADVCVGWDGLGGTVTNERPGPTLALRTFTTPSTRPTGTQDPQFAWMPGDVELF